MRRLRAAAAVVAAIAGVAAAPPLHAQGYSPFSDFAAIGAARAGNLQLRIAPLAPDRGLPGIHLTVAGGDPDTSFFTGSMRRGFPIVWVDSRSVRAEVAPERMIAAIAAVGGIAEATGGAVDSMGAMMLTIVRGRDDSLGVYETTLARETAATLCRALSPVFGVDPRVGDALAALACGCGIATGPPAGAAGRSLRATLERVSYDPARRELSARLVVRNLARAPVPGPIAVVVRPEAGSIRLVEPDGLTCRVFDPGTPFVRLAADGPLAPGASVEREVRFANPLQVNARFDLRVFVGEAER